MRKGLASCFWSTDQTLRSCLDHHRAQRLLFLMTSCAHKSRVYSGRGIIVAKNSLTLSGARIINRYQKRSSPQIFCGKPGRGIFSILGFLRRHPAAMASCEPRRKVSNCYVSGRRKNGSGNGRLLSGAGCRATSNLR